MSTKADPTFGQATHTLTVIGQQSPSADDLRILHDGYLAALMQGIKAGTLPDLVTFRTMLGLGTALSTIATLTVDHAQSLSQMILGCACNWNKPDITAKKFPPVVGEGIVTYEWKLFHFNHDTFSDNAKTAIEEDDPANPWMPADIGCLLAFGKKHPEEQRKYPIVALGSVARVSLLRHVPCLRGDGACRWLSLRRWSGGWLGYFRFLAVRPVKLVVA